MFDVLFVTITEEVKEEQLQSEIEQQLGVSLQDIINRDVIASVILNALHCRRYFLLLDDVWSEFDPAGFGIHENGKDNKAVFASRNSNVCRYMLADDIIFVDRLSDDDALKLFQESLGRNINSSFKPLAQQIVKECANLPILIDKVVRPFRGKEENILLWQAGLNRLIVYPGVRDQSMDEVLNLLAFCYEGLDDEDKKFCFLYSALHPEGSEIYKSYLLECWKAEGLIHEMGLFTAYDRGCCYFGLKCSMFCVGVIWPDKSFNLQLLPLWYYLQVYTMF